jgi:signal transduction histidine kinase/ActR/RegA family two-component response regulator
MPHFFTLGRIFLVNLLDVYFLKFPVFCNWFFIGFNLYCYYYYWNNVFLLIALLLVLNLSYLLYQDYQLFNLKIKQEILATIFENYNSGILCFDARGKTVIHNNTMEKLFPQTDLSNIASFLQYFKPDDPIIPEVKNLLALLIKEGKNIEQSFTVEQQELSFFFQCLRVSNSKLFSMIISPKTTIYQKNTSIIEEVLFLGENGYLILDFRHRILFCNEAICNWLELSNKDIKYANIEDFLQDKNLVNEIFDEERKKGMIQLKSKNHNKDLLWEKEVMQKQKNKDSYIFLRLWERSNVVKDNREEDIINRSPLAVISFKNSGEIISFNKSAQQIIGSKITANYNITNIFPQEILDKILVKTRTITGNNFYDFKLESSVFNPLIKKVRVYPIDLSTIKVFIIMNITEFFLLEQQLLHAQRLMTTGEILSGVIHDLNNYLMSILGYAESLFSQINIYDPTYTNMMHLQNNAVKASNLIRYLLNMSRKHDGPEPFIDNFNGKIADLLRSIAKILGKNIEIKFKHDNNIPVVKIGEIHLEQILTNLLINSRDAIMEKIKQNKIEKGLIYITTEMIKYSPPGQSYSDPKDYMKISIIDNGLGIAPANLQKVFDAFYSTKGNSGVGLGLSTVKKIVEEQGGVVNIESQENAGTTMSILLPTQPDTAASKTISEKSSSYGTSNTDILLDSGTILILEDEQSIRRLLTEQLKRIGYEVIDVENGKDALKTIESYQGTIDVFISDVMLPDMSLVELCLKVKKKYQEIIIILSSGTTEDQVDDIVAGSFQYTFFNKPFPLKTMFHAIQQLKNKKKT